MEHSLPSVWFLPLALVLGTAANAETPLPAPIATPAGPKPILRAAFLQNMDSDFARMDANHDGKLTRQEIEAFQHAQALARIMARNEAVFKQLDTNHDGMLSPQEFARFHAEPPPPDARPMLQKFDANRDGVIGVIEFRAATVANFDRLDTNKDGVVDAAEMQAGGVVRQ